MSLDESDLFGPRDVSDAPPSDAVTVVAYGGGVNSTALLCGWIERGLRPVDAIVFSDTGGERPETYRHIEAVSAWLRRHRYPGVIVVRKVTAAGDVETLEQNCLDHAMLPSLAYGFKKCSLKFKVQPQDKFYNHFPTTQASWHRGERVVKLIGYDADERHRARRSGDTKYWYRHPLIEWGWGRAECLTAIRRAGLDVPAKSACFFCPANTASEIKELQRDHPDLMARALAMEQRGLEQATSVLGLGRRFAWRDLVRGRPIPLFETGIACECYDGSDDEEEGRHA